MYCKNCGKKLDDETRDICRECEANLNTSKVMEDDNVEVIKEVGNNNNNTNSNNNFNSNTYTNTSYNSQGTGSRKSKIAAGLFGIFLGAFGVHNFYLWYTGKAVAQLLITVLSCGVLSFVSYIWAFIEGILILTGSIDKDAMGVPLGE